VVCSACGAENRDEARFCDACGAPLAATAVQEHRKQVTVLFCDVSGSAALGERLDPEAVRATMARYFDAAREAIERHGGTVEKFIGDAVMARAHRSSRRRPPASSRRRCAGDRHRGPS
jgi:class 3 adenylate cyclase